MAAASLADHVRHRSGRVRWTWTDSLTHHLSPAYHRALWSSIKKIIILSSFWDITQKNKYFEKEANIILSIIRGEQYSSIQATAWRNSTEKKKREIRAWEYDDVHRYVYVIGVAYFYYRPPFSPCKLGKYTAYSVCIAIYVVERVRRQNVVLGQNMWV